MNRQADAEELNVQLDSMIATGKVETQQKCFALTALAAELRDLPDPDFKARLKAELLEQCPASAPWQENVEQITSTAAFAEIIPIFGAKDSRLFPVDHRSFLASFISHTALIALIASGIWVGRGTILRSSASNRDLTYLPADGGGGGSGDRSAVPTTRGTPPRMSARQLAPATIVVRRDNPLLPVDATVVGPPDLNLPQSQRIGDLISSNVVIPSNGSGTGGGAGEGAGTGLGGGSGLGYEDGVGVGAGGGVFNLGTRGVMPPRTIYDPEPEYSEEARKVKHEGTVMLSVIVDQQGRTRDLRVLRSLGLGLDEKAMEAVKKWKFSPGTKDGIPVAVRVNVEVNFRLY